MADLYPADLLDLVSRAFARLRRRLRHGAPTLSVHALGWMRSLAGAAPPQAYFTHRNAFPMLLLPWRLEESVRGVPDPAFHRDVVYSTLTGYYFVRMIDDLMDGDHPPDRTVLPALIIFHTEFQLAYQRHFPHGHPFWEALVSASFAAAETASRDAELPAIDRTQFLAISARKIAGARVPIAAVCHRYDRADLLGPWSEFVDVLGCWHQMFNDIFDWSRDLANGRTTYFLSQAAAQAGPDGSIAEWVIADGLDWGRAQLDEWMEQLLVAADQLGPPPLTTYLEERRRAMEVEWRGMEASRVALRRMAAAMR
jgi:hypothetical protein